VDHHEWIPVTDGAHWDQSPAWAPDGRAIYYVNRHDGFSCFMARSIAADGHPEGAPWVVRHMHSPSQTLMRSNTNRGSDALWVANGRLFFMLDTRQSDLWVLRTAER
jgi:Tol biopolymer transport system component